jgi:hypothetical protein
MHRGLVVTGLAGVEEQPRPGASKLRVPSVLVKNPTEVMVDLAEPVQVAVMATGLAHPALPYFKDLPLAVVTEKPERPAVGVCSKQPISQSETESCANCQFSKKH